MDVVLRIHKSEESLINALQSENSLDPDIIEGAGFDGSNDMLTILISVTTSTLTILTTFFKNRWSRNKPVSIEVDGMKVTGADPEQIEKLLQQMIEAKQNGEPTQNKPTSGTLG